MQPQGWIGTILGIMWLILSTGLRAAAPPPPPDMDPHRLPPTPVIPFSQPGAPGFSNSSPNPGAYSPYPAVPYLSMGYPTPSTGSEPKGEVPSPGFGPTPTYTTGTHHSEVPFKGPKPGEARPFPRDSKASQDPRWKIAVKDYEKRFKAYQKSLDRILASHGDRWESLADNSADKKKCEQILAQWQADERRMEMEFHRLEGSQASGPRSTVTKTGHNGELTADDIDR